MTAKKMLQKLHLSEDALQRIRGAVEQTERKTSGEIAVAIAVESDRYAFWELLAALIAGVAVYALLLPLSPAILTVYSAFFWHFDTWRLPAFLGITSFGLVGLLYALANIPAIDRLIVPRRVRSRAVFNRAMRYFSEAQVYDTKDRSGILIFVSYLEQEVRILADKGITAKISGDLWALIAEDLASGIGRTGAEETFIRAIERCGELLEQHFPAHKENPDELANALVILED
jgi:putative membrane protein